jgi:hypothetical protein
MPNFRGNKYIIVQPYTYKYPYEFEFTVCSAAGSNDGFLPFGRTISSIDITAIKYDEDGTEDSQLVEDDDLNEFVLTVYLTYPSANGVGRYKLRFVLTLDDGSKEEADFGRILAVDR